MLAFIVHFVEIHVIGNYICECLGVRCVSCSADVDVVDYFGEFVSDTTHDEGPRRGSAVSACNEYVSRDEKLF